MLNAFISKKINCTFIQHGIIMEKNNELNTILKNLQRCFKNRTPITKFIKKLRTLNKLDVLIKLNEGVELTLLMYCCRDNLLTEVKELLSGKITADPTVTNNAGFNALLIAILAANANSNYKLEIIDELLKYQPEKQVAANDGHGNALYWALSVDRLDIAKKIAQVNFPAMFSNVINTQQETVLHLAIKKNYLDFAKKILEFEHEKQLLQGDKEGIIPLHLALEKGDLALVQYLLNFIPEQQLQQKSKANETVFDFAVYSKKLDLIEWLITKLPEILNLRSIDGFTPLHRACKEGSLELVKLLLKNGAAQQVTAKDSQGGIPLLAIGQMPDKCEIVKLLLEYEPVTQLQAHFFLGNIFHVIATQGDLKLLTIIKNVAEKININLAPLLLNKNAIGLIPLVMIIGLPTLDNETKTKLIREFLTIDNKLQLLQTDNKENTPLLRAIECGDKNIVKLLLEDGCTEQLNLKNKPGFTPLAAALIYNRIDIIRLLLSFYSEDQLKDSSIGQIPLLHLAVVRENVFQLFLESGLIKNIINVVEPNFGGTALHAALNINKQKIALKLIEYGADINAIDHNGWAPIHIVCERGYLRLFHTLLANKANLTLRLKNEFTLLHIASQHGNLTIVRELLNTNEISIDTTNLQGSTPLCLAAIRNHIPVIRELLTRGANPNIVIDLKNNKLPLFVIALQLLKYEAMSLLVTHGLNLDLAFFIGATEVTLRDMLQMMHTDAPQKYQWLISKVPGLPLFEKPVTKTTQKFSFQDGFLEFNQDVNLKPRRYLSEIGLSDAEVEILFEDLKQKQKKLKQPTKFFESNDNEVKQCITWLNGALDSNNQAIKPIIAPGCNNMYCYLDSTNLVEQGCDESKLHIKRFKFDGIHIKKLDDDKGNYEETLLIQPSHSPQTVRYTHELKINKLDRILLFKLDSDSKNGSLYVGLRYLQGGLHSQGQINSLKDSINQGQNNYLTVNWPEKEMQNNTNSLRK